MTDGISLGVYRVKNHFHF